MTDRLKALADAGVSIWLDDLSRERIETGNLADLVKEKSVVGVTTNPTIFAGAIADGERYDDQVQEPSSPTGKGVDEVIFELTTEDVRNACDVLAPVAESTADDGRVSIEVEPDLARDTARDDRLGAGAVGGRRPAQRADQDPGDASRGLPAITAVIAQGISVNVTLIFSLERYQAVMDAYLAGLEQARDAGLDLSGIRSVASFFVSRVDSEVDARLEKIGTDEALALRGKAAVANARVAYGAFADVVASDRWKGLAAAGANAQRPLWASTGVKNPDYSDTMYVSDLVVADTVNTMPEKTMDAFADHGEVTGDEVTGTAGDAQAVLDQIVAAGVDWADVMKVLEDEGVDKFVASWEELVETVKAQMEKQGS